MTRRLVRRSRPSFSPAASTGCSDKNFAASSTQDLVGYRSVVSIESVVLFADPGQAFALVLEGGLAVLVSVDLTHNLVDAGLEGLGIRHHERGVGATGFG